MRIRTWLAAVATFGVTVLGATPANAFSIVGYHWWDFSGAGCLSQACWVTWIDVSVYSDPRNGDCAGQDGSYTSCTFLPYCQTEGWGATSYDLACGDLPPQSCPGEVALADPPPEGSLFRLKDCRLESYGDIIVPVGTCHDVHALVTARSPVDSVSLGHNVRLCTDRHGPSAVAIS